ncbi:hypothetical protein [Actinomadura hibisca]|uniref:hypothetical protein n=1 Tax=Actinomadura hibisca TaxID=68565 RepID=UPI00082CBF94|nr:hypothetical protein [Actinomadura hibisca]
MSGPNDPGETEAPASPAPPSFGESGSAPESPGQAAEALRLPPFGLQKPWWASEDDAGGAAPASPEPSRPDDARAPDDAGPAPLATGDVALPGALVAGRGATQVDTRGAVPRRPVPAVASPGPSAFADTDPDGIPVMPPEARRPGNGTGGALSPVLVPDAILPPGVTPPADSTTPIPQAQPVPQADEPAGEPEPQPTVITPVSHAEGGLPIDAEPGERTAPQPAVKPGDSGPGGIFGSGPLHAEPSGGKRDRRPLLIGGGAAAALIVAVAVFAVAGSGDDKPAKPAKARVSAPAAKPAPQQPPPPAPVDITSEKTDTRPLALTEAFPQPNVTVGGRPYVRDRTSVNHRCSLAARGVMAQTLTQEGCRSVVRVTYLDGAKSLAVTTGIAVMPNRPVALRVSKVGDPAAYEWFRGMAGKNSQQIDQAGGYALSTVRGRYIVYAYAQYANGKKARTGDTTLRDAARQFIDLGVRPIEARAGR